MVGNTLLSATHTLCWSKGVWICLCRGSYCTAQGKSGVKFLGRRCTGRVARGRDLFLRRFLQGAFPHPSGAWPEAPAMAFEDGQRVVLKGLVAQKALNGEVGTLVHFDVAAGRWEVALEGVSASVRVREACLAQVER